MAPWRAAAVRWLPVLLPAWGLTLGVVFRQVTAEERPAAFTTDAPPAALVKGTFTGAFSCSSTACHQRPGNQGDRGCEFTTWFSVDPHRIVYQDTALAERIGGLFYRNPRGTRPGADEFCLKCHGMSVDRPHADASVLPACELCHGAAGGWLAQHYVKDWPGRTPADKKGLGFRATKDVRVRAELCVDCHVGRPSQEVNHDLIAAGHPPLNFEFATHFARLPRHWSNDLSSVSQARDWSVGQLVSAEAALRLLASRADPKAARPWPEFAEHDCRSCHHELRADEAKPARGGVPANRWYTGALEDRLFQGADLKKDLANLRALLARPLPPAREVAETAKSAMEKVRTILDAMSNEP
jgi:hypothetical protein